MKRCTGTYKAALPADYARVRCNQCGHGHTERNPGEPCGLTWYRRPRFRPTTGDLMTERQRQDMRDAGRGHQI